MGRGGVQGREKKAINLRFIFERRTIISILYVNKKIFYAKCFRNGLGLIAKVKNFKLN